MGTTMNRMKNRSREEHVSTNADMRVNIYFTAIGSIIIMVTKDATPWGLLVAFTDVVGI
jgi:hypothetical protein